MYCKHTTTNTQLAYGPLRVLTGAPFTDLQMPLRCPLICHRTITDLEMENNVLGTVIAAVSVVSSGMQQIFCRTMQQKHNLASHELLANTAPAQVPVSAMPSGLLPLLALCA